MKHTIAVIGAPTSAGAHFNGLEKGPEHFRRAGLLAELVATDLCVLDFGDLPVARYEPDRSNPRFRSLPRVADVARQVAERVELATREQAWPVVVGGDCTITIGVVSGFLRAGGRVGLLYFDGHLDLNTPETSRYGVLDSMGMGHMLGLHDNELSRLGPRFPLLDPGDIVVFGYDPKWSNVGEEELRERFGLRDYRFPDILTARAPDAAACELEDRVDRFIVHFDVDVLDYIDTPVGNMPKYSGPSLVQAAACLQRFVASPKFGALVISEFNPDRDPEYEHARRVIRVIADTLRDGNQLWV